MTPSNPAPVGDEREPSDSYLLSVLASHHSNNLSTEDAVKCILARFGTRPAAEPSQSGSAGEALTDEPCTTFAADTIGGAGWFRVQGVWQNGRRFDMRFNSAVERGDWIEAQDWAEFKCTEGS